jgi:hypothetical protein
MIRTMKRLALAAILRGLKKRGMLVSRTMPKSEVERFLARFRQKYVSVELVRVGGENDGGYLVPAFLEEIDYCFSPGVDYTATFEAALGKRYGVKSFLADASVSSAPASGFEHEFLKKFLGARTDGDFITLSDWVGASNIEEDANVVLQMDIEGGEYDVLLFESAEFFARFPWMVIEFHRCDRLFLKDFHVIFSTCFEKIFRNFSICHVHPNNCCGIAVVEGVELPRVVEVTFVRNDLVDRLRIGDPVSLPHRLDMKNVPENEDIMMPAVWWEKAQGMDE